MILAKFPYSPFGKALEKQIEDYGEKQIKAIKEHGKQPVKSNEFNKHNLPFDKQKEMLRNLVDGRMEEMKKVLILKI